MDCPKCFGQGRQFQPAPGVTCFAFTACHGMCMWFPRGQLAKLCHAPCDIPDLAGSLEYLRDTSLDCPGCKEDKLITIPFAANMNKEIEVCPSCEGVWLDTQELAVIRQYARKRGDSYHPYTQDVAAFVTQYRQAKSAKDAQEDESSWYVAIDGKALGPYSKAKVQEMMLSYEEEILVYKDGMENWTPASQIFETPLSVESPVTLSLETGFNKIFVAPPPVEETVTTLPEVVAPIELEGETFRILGDESQFVEVSLAPGEPVVADMRCMVYYMGEISTKPLEETSPNGVATVQPHALGSKTSAWTVFTNTSNHDSRIAFTSSNPGKVIPFSLENVGGPLLCQKGAILCGLKGVEIQVALQKDVQTDLYGADGFVLCALQGDGEVMLHACGTLATADLAAGETMVVDTGSLVAMTNTITFTIGSVDHISPGLGDEEGFLQTTLTGPGRVWIQSMSLGRLAGRLYGVSRRSA